MGLVHAVGVVRGGHTRSVSRGDAIEGMDPTGVWEQKATIQDSGNAETVTSDISRHQPCREWVSARPELGRTW